MSKDKRKYLRRPAVLDLELQFPSGELLTVQSRDISEGGLFLLMDSHNLPMLGEILHLKLIGDSQDKEDLPGSAAVVVHHGADGIGVAFIEMELDDEH